MRIKEFFIRNKIIFASFFMPALIVTAAFAVTGIYPFGGDQIAVIDMYHQYVPFLSELQHKLQEGGSLFYTWNGAGGSNFWNLLAYYGASPLNLILALFPQNMIMEGVTLILVIKIGLAGSFMALYLRYRERGRDWAVMAFATLYALCSYVMAYYWCIMWMDAVALLPLCVLGLNRLMDGKNGVMYTVSLALIVFINYYMAIMVCIFILFYYPVLYFTKYSGRGVRGCALLTGRAVGYSLLGVAMAAVMLLPTYISMGKTYYISAEMPDNLLFYNDALDIVNQLLPYSDLTFREGLPNLYCGTAVVMLLVFYAVSRSISLREKLINAFFLVFMFLSLNINKLDFIWHGFHFPNQLPYRYTFVICFVLIGMAYRAFTRLGEIKEKAVWAVVFAGLAYYLIAQKIVDENIDNVNLFFYGGAAWLIIYSASFIVYKREIIGRKAFIFLLAALTAAEVFSGTCTAFDTVGNTQRSTYFENYDDVTALVDRTEREFARTEIDNEYLLNCPAFYHYKGMSQFSSSLNADTTALMEKIGLEGSPEKNRFNYNQTDPVTNAMLNVKYMIAKNLPLEDSDFTEVAREGKSVLYESRYPLSIGYMTGPEIRTWDIGSDDPFDVLDSYVRATTGNRCGDVFETVEEPVVTSDNLDVTENGGGVFTVEEENPSYRSTMSLEYTADATQKYYVFVEASNADTITVRKNDDVTSDIEIREDCGSIVNIGEVKKGEDFKVYIKYAKRQSGSVTCRVRTLDYDEWNRAYDIISADMMKVTDSGDRYIKGVVNASKDGVLVTSVPYDDGWSLTVDGQKREIQELMGGVWISVPLGAGSHEIELSFTPPGLIMGLVITCLAILVLISLTVVGGRIRGANGIRRRAMFLSDRREDVECPPEGSDCNRI